jgi:hypothetical protein
MISDRFERSLPGWIAGSSGPPSQGPSLRAWDTWNPDDQHNGTPVEEEVAVLGATYPDGVVAGEVYR